MKQNSLGASASRKPALVASDQAASRLAPPGVDPAREEGAKTCGTCRLWGANFYPQYRSFPVNKTCCADVVMDLPASFIPNRQTMEAGDGEGCICWEQQP